MWGLRCTPLVSLFRTPDLALVKLRWYLWLETNECMTNPLQNLLVPAEFDQTVVLSCCTHTFTCCSSGTLAFTHAPSVAIRSM